MSLPAEAATPRAVTALPLLAVVFVALVLRLVAVFALSGLAPENNDQVQRYDRLALSLLAGEGFARDGRPVAAAPPVYPLFLAGVYGLFGDSPLSFRLALALVDASTVGIVFFLGRSLLGPRVGLFAAFGAALTPYTWPLLVMGGSDVLFLFLHTLFLAVFAHAWVTGRIQTFGIAGGLLGIATLCRAVPLLLPLGLTALVLAAGRGNGRRRAAQSALLVATFVAVLTPWTVRNWLAFDRLVPVQTLGGFHLALTAVTPEERAEILRPRQNEDHSDRSDKIDRDRFFYRVALEQIRDKPGVFLGGIGGRLVQMWSRTHSGRFQSWLLLANGALLALAAAGTLLARARWPLLPLLGVFAYYVALHTFMFAMFRYMLPVIPALLVLAAVPLAVTVDRWRWPAIGEQSPST